MEPFEQAGEFHRAGRFAEAEKIYEMLLTQNHDNGGLLATLGTLYLQTNRFGLAMTLLHRAIERGQGGSDVVSNLSLCYKNSGQPDKAVHYAKMACEMPDASAHAIANYSGFYTNTGQPEKTTELCERALKMDPELTIAHWNLALALLESGQWERGWQEHEHGLVMKPNTSRMRTDRAICNLPHWDGQPGIPITVYGEQGIGDEIMFASMLPDVLKTNPVVFECHKRLVTLFEKSFGIPCYGTREDTEVHWPNNHPELKARIAIGSLGKFYRNKGEDFPGMPYLKAESLPRGGKLRVGVSWTGGLKAGRVLTRSVPLSWWEDILGQDCEFVSLQYTKDSPEEIALLEKAKGLKVQVRQEPFEFDYYETAKLVMSCDLVISVCTSVIHLAGALGVPCWVMVPNKPAWRYQVKGPMPWYHSVRLYRQPQGDTWMPVLDKVAADLRQFVAERNEKAA